MTHDPAADWAELKRLTRALLIAWRDNVSDATTLATQHTVQHRTISERCSDPRYHQAYTAAVRAEPGVTMP